MCSVFYDYGCKCLIWQGFYKKFRKSVDNFVDIPCIWPRRP